MTEVNTLVSIGTSDLKIYPLGLGTNTFNNPAEPAEYHAVLDGFVSRGGNFLDTADMYSHWVPGNSGGESETVIGSWLEGRGKRDDVIIATKVSAKPDLLGLAPATINQGVAESLTRLQTDYIDLYYAHYHDPNTPMVESAAVFEELLQAGKIRAVGISNFSGEQIDEWIAVCDANGFTRPVAFQPEYSLVAREYERELLGVSQRNELSVFPYRVLAGGFLSGKYRSEADLEGRARGGSVKQFLTEPGLALLVAMDEVAAAHNTDVASVALAWAMADGKITAPLTAATGGAQLDQLFAATRLTLSADAIASLDAASESFR